ncbi:hypothetical protein RCL_jg24608.t1 [Rhizophagus clarus]|uniref:Uncharacterized protein n=1 Tax=Rhizophagus clarus TaxID=94130 RepID=A0A8H3R4Z8_9GLOM|nr:hypothetical protein RCL_jg24608.t1 [Rhizophagus clarus]
MVLNNRKGDKIFRENGKLKTNCFFGMALETASDLGYLTFLFPLFLGNGLEDSLGLVMREASVGNCLKKHSNISFLLYFIENSFGDDFRLKVCCNERGLQLEIA